MKKMNPLKKNPPSLNAFRGGSYSLIISAVVLALLVVANVFASALPSAMTKYDISSTKLYSVTSNTKVVVNALEQDVTIYWIVQSGKEDDIIENLLSKYETLSGHIGRFPDFHGTVYKRNRSKQQLDCGMRRPQPVYRL